jgi:hypothetical protein
MLFAQVFSMLRSIIFKEDITQKKTLTFGNVRGMIINTVRLRDYYLCN